MIFLLAADALGLPPAQCVVVEDAAAGIQAAPADGKTALGIAHLGDEALRRAARTRLVVTSLNQLDIDAPADGALRARPVTETAPHA
jgi:beta-phosphoglucomutase-like phosphatase (HAD superfamily)